MNYNLCIEINICKYFKLYIKLIRQISPQYNTQIIFSMMDRYSKIDEKTLAQQKIEDYEIFNEKKFDQLDFSTNNVMVDFINKTIYMPAFLTLSFQNLIQLEIADLASKGNATLYFKVFYGNLGDISLDRSEVHLQEKQLRERLLSIPEASKIIEALSNDITLNFQKDKAIKLEGLPSKNNQEDDDEDKAEIFFKNNKARKLLKFSVSTQFSLRLDSDIFLSPFEIINNVLEVTVQDVTLNNENDQKWTIKFNLMDHLYQKFKVQTSDWTKYGNYDLIENRVKAFYSNYRVFDAQLFQYSAQKRICQLEKFKRRLKQKQNMKKTVDKQNKSYKPQKQIDNGQFDIITANSSPRNSKRKSPKPNQSQEYLNEYQSELSSPRKRPESQNKIIETRETYWQRFQNFFINLYEIMFPPHQDMQISDKIEPFRYAYFNAPLYKYPLSSLIVIFLPMFLLAVVNLGIFFQTRQLPDRIGNVAALTLAYAGVSNIVRSQLPPVPKILMAQILVYTLIFTTMLALVDSVIVRNEPNEYDMYWRGNWRFIASFVIVIVTFVFVVLLYILHKFYWQPTYNLPYQQTYKMFIRKRWLSLECDLYFNDKFEMMRQGSNQGNRQGLPFISLKMRSKQKIKK